MRSRTQGFCDTPTSASSLRISWPFLYCPSTPLSSTPRSFVFRTLHHPLSDTRRLSSIEPEHLLNYRICFIAFATYAPTISPTTYTVGLIRSLRRPRHASTPFASRSLNYTHPRIYDPQHRIFNPSLPFSSSWLFLDFSVFLFGMRSLAALHADGGYRIGHRAGRIGGWVAGRFACQRTVLEGRTSSRRRRRCTQCGRRLWLCAFISAATRVISSSFSVALTPLMLRRIGRLHLALWILGRAVTQHLSMSPIDVGSDIDFAW